MNYFQIITSRLFNVGERFEYRLLRGLNLIHRPAMMMALVLIVCHLAAGGVMGEEQSLAAETVISLSSLTGPNGYRLEGREDGDQAGRSLHNAGDVNGDGLDDFIIGAPSANPDGVQNAGEAYVVFGKNANPTFLPLADLAGSNGFRLVGVTYNDNAGQAVSGGGDINNDGYADLIIGAPGADRDEDNSESGAAFVVFGRPNFPARLNLKDLNGTSGFRLNGIDSGDRAGAAVALVGDVNGDGFDDILIGAPEVSVGNKDSIGQAYAVWGRTSFPPVMDLANLDGSNGFQINGISAETYTGKVLSPAGDLNQDGFADIALSAGSYLTGKSTETGTVFVVFGRQSFTANFNLTGINGTNGFRIEGMVNGDNAGRSIATAGDVNGDGRNDLVIGAPFATGRKGEAYVVFGQPAYATALNLDDLNGANGIRLMGSEANGEAGTAVGAADVNGDGLDDVVIGASAAGTDGDRFMGMTYVVLGKFDFESSLSLGSLGSSGFRLDGAAANHQSGQTISTAGDINGDGYDEILVGAPNAGPGVKSDLGYVYLLQGGPTLGLDLPVTHTGTPDNDPISGTGGNDVMLGHRGNDQLSAAAGNDVLKGGAGDDMLNGAGGGDRLIGGNGQDTAAYTGSSGGVTVDLFTGKAEGDDAAGDSLRSIERLRGSASADTLSGDALANQLEGAGGDDYLNGGRGDDTFVYGPQSGDDTIPDFTPGAGSDDYLDFTKYPAIAAVSDLTIQPQGANTLITLPGGETIVLKNVPAGALHADDYRFAGAPLALSEEYGTPVNMKLTINAPGVLMNDQNPTANPLSAVLVASPAHGNLKLQTTGAFTYTPDANFVGMDEFTYLADNGQKSNVARVAINVTLAPPSAVDDVYTAELGSILSIAAPGVLANDVTSGPNPLQAFIEQPPVSGVLEFNSDGSFSYTPAVDYPTQDTFTYKAGNGLLSNIATVTINLLDPEGPPIAVNDSYELMIDETLSVPAPGVLGNDIDPLSGPMSAVLGAEPAHGSVILNAGGAFTYVPDPGYKGTDSFTYRADNGQLSNVATVELVVKSTTDPSNRLFLPFIVGR